MTGDQLHALADFPPGKPDKLKRKAVLLQAWSGLDNSRNLRLPDFMTTAQDDGKFVSRRHRPALPPRNVPSNHFF